MRQTTVSSGAANQQVPLRSRNKESPEKTGVLETYNGSAPPQVKVPLKTTEGALANIQQAYFKLTGSPS